MKRSIIAEGNYCKASYNDTTGMAEYHIGVWPDAQDEYKIVYEDGLYKLYKNDKMTIAATEVLIKVSDFMT